MKQYAGIKMFFAFFAIQILFGMISQQGWMGEGLALFLSGIVTMAWAYYLYKDYLAFAWADLKGQTTISKVLALSLGLFFLNALIRVLIISLLENLIDMDTLGANQQMLEEIQLNINPLFFIIPTAIAAPFNEEMVFRQAMNGWVFNRPKSYRWLMAILSTLLFAALHVFSPQDFLIYLPLSISMYWIYARYGYNVWASIIFHFVNNSIAVIAMYALQFLPQDLQVISNLWK